MVVRVMAHPVTKGPASGAPPVNTGTYAGVVVAFQFYNCWTASVGFGGLDAQNNGILVHQMTVHHEGFDVFFGNQEARTLTHSLERSGTTAVGGP